jgi:hypothetical protein
MRWFLAQPYYCPRLTTVFPAISPTKCGDSFWRWCTMMSPTTYQKFTLSSHPRRSGSCLHLPLVPVLDLTSTCHGKSICVPINSLPFGCIYHTRTCSQMLSTFSHKRFTKIHPDAPRNACDLQTAAGRVCHVNTLWSPTQVTMHHHHLVFNMLHITEDSIVQTFLDSCLQSSRTCKSFLRCL